MIIFGMNPVREAIRAHPDRIRWIAISSADKGRLARLADEGRDAGVDVRLMPPDRLAKVAEGGVHNGVVAELADADYADFDDIIRSEGAPERVFVLDGVQDPQNLGAVLRVADVFGFGLVVVPRHESAGLSAAVVKASAGASEWVPVAQVTNLARAIEQMQEAGYWVYGADAEGDALGSFDLTGKVVIVLGNEGRGVRRNVIEHCDRRIAIPMRGKIESLNVSTAAAVIAWEVERQSGKR
ncbi:MAG: 23S rRNA (guanosine(2251)-2'-O)-methyltransferase RlmB [Acidobacteria bacterium]|nr:23S rRNA (guanosine(2251)-2'-O)-methyltransferase RlmB [Acidobacteriota bacterium]